MLVMVVVEMWGVLTVCIARLSAAAGTHQLCVYGARACTNMTVGAHQCVRMRASGSLCDAIDKRWRTHAHTHTGVCA